jgi:hypothetical protein
MFGIASNGMNIFKKFLAVLASHENGQPGSQIRSMPDPTSAARRFEEEANRERELAQERQRAQQERQRAQREHMHRVEQENKGEPKGVDEEVDVSLEDLKQNV